MSSAGAFRDPNWHAEIIRTKCREIHRPEEGGAPGCANPDCPCQTAGPKGKTHCPAHPDHSPSLEVAVENGKVLVKCHAGCDQHAVLEALRAHDVWPQTRQARRAEEQKAAKDDPEHFISTGAWEYVDAEGQSVLRVVRFDSPGGKKKYAQFHVDPDDADKWLPGGISPEAHVLYRLPEIIGAVQSGSAVHVVEGEKCADALFTLGFTATTLAGGANAPIQQQFVDTLRGAPVIVHGDNDEPGQRKMLAWAMALHGVASSVRVEPWSDLKPAGDVVDWLADGHTADEFTARMLALSPWVPPQPSDIGPLLKEIIDLIDLYVKLRNDHQRVAVALYAAMCYTIDAFEEIAYLLIESPSMRSGKTRLLRLLEALLFNSWYNIQPSAAVLYRRIDRDHPTFLLDEVDTLYGDHGEFSEAVRGILNASNIRGVTIGRVNRATGDIEEYDPFGPKILAGIASKLPSTLRDRSIAIRIIRANKEEKKELLRFRRREVRARVSSLRSRLVAWASVATAELESARPIIPPELDDRAADGWESLLAVADMAGGDWPEKARMAAIALQVDKGIEDESVSEGNASILILRDIYQHFHFTPEGKRRHKPLDHVKSSDLVTHLIADKERPWADFGRRNQGLNPRSLSDLLRPFGVKPQPIGNPDKGTQARGYRLVDFTTGDLFARYGVEEEPGKDPPPGDPLVQPVDQPPEPPADPRPGDNPPASPKPPKRPRVSVSRKTKASNRKNPRPARVSAILPIRQTKLLDASQKTLKPAPSKGFDSLTDHFVDVQRQAPESTAPGTGNGPAKTGPTEDLGAFLARLHTEDLPPTKPAKGTSAPTDPPDDDDLPQAEEGADR